MSDIVHDLLQFARPRDPVPIEHVSSQRSLSGVELRIADNGPGLTDEARERLFEPFFTTKHRGTGLGLATARRILEAHHGSIDLERRPEGGTIAIATLPATAGQPTAMKAAARGARLVAFERRDQRCERWFSNGWARSRRPRVRSSPGMFRCRHRRQVSC